MKRRRAAVTGLGIITAVGCEVQAFWENLLKGVCGIDALTLFDASRYRSQKAAEVKGFDPGLYFSDRHLQRMSRCDQLGLKATAEAILDSGLDLQREDRERVGIFIGGGAGGIFSAERYRKEMLQKGRRRVRPSLLLPFATCTITDAIAEEYGILGPRATIATACSSSATAIGYALSSIRSGEVDVAIGGGSESLSEVTFGGFNALRSIDEDCCRPFDLNRKGLSLGEGGAILVIEDGEHALRRGAKVYAEVLGYGLTGDGYHMTAPDPEGNGALRAMKEALRDSGIGPEDVSYINAHGTATPANDLAETRAIKALLGQRARKIPVSAIKSMVGHCLGAAGAVEAVATVLSVKENRIPPTIHYQTPDPECDLDYVPNQSRIVPVEVAFSNSFAFGGNNTTLVFGKWKS
ncbi:MAG: beta-ketoacyl-[acyl-carrier-protein] synthase family protein [Thermodesulfobacteriota bacterium]|jgi:3-oxoacyl-[acyl-carrier-protein] synthase II